jgi:hypothetical protein
MNEKSFSEKRKNKRSVGQSPTYKARITTDPPVGGELGEVK